MAAIAQGSGSPDGEVVLGVEYSARRRVTWAVTGLYFGFSPAWLRGVTTATSFVALAMLVLVQRAQRRRATAIQAQYEELVRRLQAVAGAAARERADQPPDWRRLRELTPLPPSRNGTAKRRRE